MQASASSVGFSVSRLAPDSAARGQVSGGTCIASGGPSQEHVHKQMGAVRVVSLHCSVQQLVNTAREMTAKRLGCRMALFAATCVSSSKN